VRKPRCCCACALSFALLFCHAPQVIAQIGPAVGNIYGTVVSQDGKPVPGAAITAVNTSGSTAASARAAVNGTFNLAGLAPGTYVLCVETVGLAARHLNPCIWSPAAVTRVSVAAGASAMVQEILLTYVKLAVGSGGATNDTSALARTWAQFSNGNGPSNVWTWDNRPIEYYTAGFSSCATTAQLAVMNVVPVPPPPGDPNGLWTYAPSTSAPVRSICAST
jgi:hypothetical protein